MANKSGFNATMSISGTLYEGTSLTDVSISINNGTIDVSDLTDTWAQRADGLKDWTISARKNYVTAEFMMMAGASGASTVVDAKTYYWPAPPMEVKVFTPGNSTTAIFTGVGYVTKGDLSLPMGAANESIEIQSDGTVPTIKSVVV